MLGGRGVGKLGQTDRQPNGTQLSDNRHTTELRRPRNVDDLNIQDDLT